MFYDFILIYGVMSHVLDFPTSQNSFTGTSIETSEG